MKVLHIGKKGVMDRYIAPDSFVGKMDRVDLPSGLTAGEYLENAWKTLRTRILSSLMRSRRSQRS